MNKRVLVVACNHAQFRHWCIKHKVNPRKVRFIGHANSMEGYSHENAYIIFTGQFWLHQNLERMDWYVKTRFPHIQDWFDNPDEVAVKRLIESGVLS